MRIAIIDDEPHFLNHVQEMLIKTMDIYKFNDYQIDKFQSKTEFLANFKAKKYDLLMVDIYIGEENGVDLAQEVRKTDNDCVIIFCTTSNEFAKESYQVRASYYLVKPIILEDMVDMFNTIDILGNKNNQTILFPDQFTCYVSDIVYTEYYNHKVTIHLNNGQEHGIHLSQKEIEDILLPLQVFCIVNRGSIVNLDKVDRIESQSVVLEDETYIAITRNRLKSVQTALLNHRVQAF